jgi:hypothetical protein
LPNQIREKNAMVIIGQKMFPTNQAAHMAEAFAGISDLPDFIAATGPFLRSVLGKGVQSTSVFHCPPDRLEESYRLLNLRYVRYMDVPGYTYSLDIWMETGDIGGAAGL